MFLALLMYPVLGRFSCQYSCSFMRALCFQNESLLQALKVWSYRSDFISNPVFLVELLEAFYKAGHVLAYFIVETGTWKFQLYSTFQLWHISGKSESWKDFNLPLHIFPLKYVTQAFGGQN